MITRLCMKAYLVILQLFFMFLCFSCFLCFTDSFCGCVFFQWHFIDLFSCIAASLFNKTYLLTCSRPSMSSSGHDSHDVQPRVSCYIVHTEADARCGKLAKHASRTSTVASIVNLLWPTMIAGYVSRRPLSNKLTTRCDDRQMDMTELAI